ncbi:13027_t:CDS:2, partial [Racocetra persica]
CPFSLHGIKKDNMWILSINNSHHCHEPSQDILSSLRQNDPSISTTSQDVYNIRKKLYRENLKDRTPIQALVEELDKSQFEYNYQCNADGHITHLFFAHHKSIELMHTYSSVLLMDCTYKTNKFKLPLLNIVVVLLTEPLKVFVTDRELALIHAIHDIFPNSKNIL